MCSLCWKPDDCRKLYNLAARRLRAKGYPAVLRDADMPALRMDSDECRRLAGMLLIPVRHPGVLAAMTIKPETIT